MRTRRTPSKTAAAAAPTSIQAFMAEPETMAARPAALLLNIAFSSKFAERIWSKQCSDGTIRLVGSVAKIQDVYHQGVLVSNDQLAGLTVEVRVSPDDFETITENIVDMIGGGVAVLFEVGDPSFSNLTVNGVETHSITFYAAHIKGMEVNKTSIGSIGFASATEMSEWLTQARVQNNARAQRRNAERTAKLTAARAAAAAANNPAGSDSAWDEAPADNILA